MPNFFRGPGIDPTLFPVDTPEKTAKVTEFIQGPANVEQAVKNLQMIMEKATITYPGVERWAVIGYCWGGKVRVSDPPMPFCKLKVTRLQLSFRVPLRPSKLVFRSTRAFSNPKTLHISPSHTCYWRHEASLLMKSAKLPLFSRTM